MLVRLLRTSLTRYRSALIIVIAVQFVQAIAGLYLPRLNAEIIDRGVIGGDRHLIWTTGAWMIVVSVIQVAGSIAAVYYGSRIAMGFGRDTRARLFSTVTSFSAREVEHFGPPSLITRITNDVQQVQLLVLMVCTMMIGSPITAVGGTIMAVREDVPLSLVLAVSVPLMLLFIVAVIRRMLPTFTLMQGRIDNVNRVLREQLMGVRVIRAFVRERTEADRFAAANADLTDVSIRAGRVMAVMFPFVMLVVNVSSIGVIWFGGKRIDAGALRIGELIAFLSYLAQILMAAMFATFIGVLWPRSAVCAERIVEVLDTQSSVVTADQPVTTFTERATVELDEVSVCYPGAEHPVLDRISLRSGPGQTSAIVGSTGSGKTTLISVILRLFDVTSGTVRVGGVDVRQLQPETLWGRIGVVPQRPYLFGGTIASNLRIADQSATEEQMWEALRIAQADGFVRAMPAGLDAAVTQGGTNLSGGQRQRLAIARAILRRPEIYLFDDSFSALDVATDARLRAALAPVVAEATVIVVAQRVSSILDADQIFVLDDGEIVGRGTHAELLEHCSTYQEIVASQLSADEAGR